MIQKLQKRILFTLTLSLTLFFWFLLFMVNFQNYRYNLQQNLNMLHQLEKPRRNIERMRDEPIDSEAPLLEDEDLDNMIERMSVCTIYYDDEGNFRLGDLNQITDFSEQELLESAGQIIERAQTEGRWKNFLFLNKTEESEKVLYLMDVSPALERVKNLFFFTILLGLLGFCLILWMSFILSKWLVKPVDQAFTRQKQFISDASHELKTPLTVIGANAELLESEVGSNKWLGYIQSETRRMSRLVNQLLSLARLENQQEITQYPVFSLSQAVTQVLLPFESIAFEQNTGLSINIEEDISFQGSEDELKQIVSILTDNALKHTCPDGFVKVALTKSYKKIQLLVSNTGDPIPPDEREKIFDRFYRSDAARDRSKNRYGLGLPIAKAIAEKNHGTIKVNCENGITTFQLELLRK